MSATKEQMVPCTGRWCPPYIQDGVPHARIYLTKHERYIAGLHGADDLYIAKRFDSLNDAESEYNRVINATAEEIDPEWLISINGYEWD